MSSDRNDSQPRTNSSSAQSDEADEHDEPLTLDYRTTTYQAENPRWLWDLFKNGPADGADRYGDRVTALIASDVHDYYDDLTDEERQQVRAMMEGHNGV